MVRINGHSDDVVEIVFCDSTQTVDCYEKDVKVAVYDNETKDGVRIIMSYGVRKAVWGATVEPLRDGSKMPWPITIEQDPERDYGVLVTVLCPDGVMVRYQAMTPLRNMV
jgi:hypothetical protein